MDKSKDAQRPPAMLESSKVPEVQRLNVQFLALAEGLIAEGEPRYNVVYALADTILDLLANEHMKGNTEFLWTWQFLRQAELGFGDWCRYLETIDSMADEIERSRAAGGTGTRINRGSRPRI